MNMSIQVEFCGRRVYGSVSNCFFANWTNLPWCTGRVNGVYKEEGTGYAKNEVSSLINKLGSTYFCNDEKGINDGYPVLKWQNEK